MKQLLVFLFLLCAMSISAQDVIVKKDGSTILSKVLEVGQEEIKYKKFDNLDGPTYTIQKSELQAINYQNGAKDTFSAPVREENRYLPNIQNDGGQRVNDKALLRMDLVASSPYKKVKTLKTVGWVGGGAFIAASLVNFAMYFTSNDEPWALHAGLLCAGLGVGWTTSFLLAANHTEKKINNQLYNASIMHYNFPFSNGSSFSLSADLLGDRTLGSNTIGLGLRYNF